MKIYNPTLIKTGEKEQIQYWESPEPDSLDFNNFANPSFEYACALRYWKESVKTLDVHPSAVIDLAKLLCNRYDIDFKELAERQKTGISLSGIEDRLEIKAICEKCAADDLCFCMNSLKQYFFLKPIPSKEEETQKLITADEMHLNMQYYMEYLLAGNEYVTPQDWISNHKHF